MIDLKKTADVFEDDLRWCANVAAGCGLLIILFGVVIGCYLDGNEKMYIVVMSCSLAFFFAIVSIVCHVWLYRERKRKTVFYKRGRRWSL